jgi:hypothetical protein
MSVDEVVRLVPEKRRPMLKRVLAPRWETIMQGLDGHKWNTLHEAMVELGLDHKRVYLVRSALRVAGLCSFDQPFGKARAGAERSTAQQQVLFTRANEGYRYRR